MSYPSERKLIVPVCTIPAEISPQALPLGAASIVAAINQSFAEKPLAPETVVEARLISIPPEFHRAQDEQAQALANQLLKLHPAALCFSLFVWNRTVLARVAAIIQGKASEIPLIAGGSEVTAGAANKDPFHYLVCGEGDESVPNLLRQLLQKETAVAGASKTDSELPPRKIFSPRANQENRPSPYLTGTLNPTEYQNGAFW